jgi:hypothetical protein
VSELHCGKDVAYMIRLNSYMVLGVTIKRKLISTMASRKLMIS